MRATFTLLGAALLGALLLSGCGSSDTYNPTVPGGAAADFTLTAAKSSLSLPQAGGSRVDYALTLTALNGFDSAVDLTAEDVPDGLTASFEPSSVTPTAAGAPATLSVVARSMPLPPLGTFHFTVMGTGGGKTHSLLLTVAVVSPPDFTISVTPASQTVTPGQTAHYTVTLTGTGFTSPAALSVSGLPDHTTAVFEPTSVTPIAGGATSTLDVHTEAPNGSSGTPLGAYTLTVTGMGGGQTHSADTSLVVGTGQGGLNGIIQ